ncbi:MAG: SAV_6107 family HEPN domain-containing protein [Jatrophihabitantaceae bacterium]
MAATTTARKGVSPGSAVTLLAQARTVLAEAAATPEVGERFRLAHLAALRIAAAVLADRGRPAGVRRRLMSVWLVLDAVAPELAEWGRYFAAGAPVRAAVEAGAMNAVSARDADDQLRSAAQFLRLVEGSLGMPAAPLAS